MRPLIDAVHAVDVLVRAGALAPVRPDRAVRMANGLRRWGVSVAAAFATSAARYGDRIALVDDAGPLTFGELDARTDRQAAGLRALGLDAGAVAGVLCRNGRGIVEATGALSKVGAHALYCNTGFSAPQLHDVLRREGASALIHDDEFTAVARDAPVATRVVADGPPAGGSASLAALTEHDLHPAARPEVPAETIILTSGTSGAPKGARRPQTASAGAAVALLDRIPYRANETIVVAAPIFHSWGFANLLVGMLLGCTVVVERHFDARRTLAAIDRHQASVLAAVPVMLSRLLDVPAAERARYDTRSLRIVCLSGSALTGDLATRAMDELGDVVYNLYGSTEVGYVSVATPADLRIAPNTAGRPPRGTLVRILDRSGHALPAGATGSIFVRGEMLFDGYTTGGSKAVVDGLMQTGDTGHFDEHGLLFVDGRDDEMIVSGGENVFPSEVEHLLASHPAIADVAVVGVPDDEWGQRLKAYVVRRPGDDRDGPDAGAGLDADAVREHVRGRLARFKVPRDVVFVDELPRNATGKVVKRALG